MRSRRDAVALAVLLLSLAAAALLLRPYAEEANEADRRMSTYRSTPFGARALFLLMEELELPARRQLQPWSVEPVPGALAGALAVLAPVDAPTPRELEALLAWLRGGGTLIFGAGGRHPLLERLGLQLLLMETAGAGALERTGRTGATAYPAPHAWTAGIDSVGGFARAFSPGSPALRTPGAAVLLRTRDDAATALVFPVGTGRVVAFSDAAVLNNEQLRDGGAAVLFARVAHDALADGGVLRFDEFHHGYREGGLVSAVRGFLTGTGMGRALLQGAVALLLLLLLAAHRLGSPRQETGQRRRSPLEHVEAVAGAYRRANALRTTRRLLLRGLERRLGRRLQHADEPLLESLRATPAGRRLKEEWDRGERGDLVALSAAVDEYVMEATAWK
jgi:hypothetical protein